MKKIISLGLSVFLLLTLFYCISVPASASTYSSEYLNKYSGTITAQGDAQIKISFTVMAVSRLEEMGVSKIVVEKKIGNSWVPMKTYTKDDYPELSTTNALLYSNHVFYSGESGREYRAEITVFGNTDSGQYS